jgi:integrase/recombinase XerD
MVIIPSRSYHWGRRRTRTRERNVRLSQEEKDVAELRLGAKPFHAAIPYFMESRVGVVVDTTIKEERRKLRSYGDRLEELKDQGLLSTCDPRAMSEADVRQFIAWMKRPDGKKNGKPWDPETQIKAQCYLHQFLRFFGNYAIEELERKGLRYPKKPKKAIKALSHDDMMALFKAADTMEGWHGVISRGMLALVFSTGCRPKEMRLAQIEDVKLAEMKFFIRHPKGEGSWGVPQDVYIIRPDVLQFLSRFMTERKEALKEMGIEKAIPLFPNLYRGGHEYYSEHAFQTIKHELEILSRVKFRIKDLRPTLTSMTVNGDLGMLVAMSQQLRHSNLATTQRHYAAIEQGAVGEKLRDAWQRTALNSAENAVISPEARCESSGQGGIRTPGFRLAKAAIFR